MCRICDHVCDDWPVANFEESVTCQLPAEHEGMHLSQNGNGTWHLWRYQMCDDLECAQCSVDLTGCMLDYTETSEAVALAMLNQKRSEDDG